MAYDPEADLLYVGTGNGGPWPEELRKSKGKDNLYVCSILAVKPETGELQWYYQMVPGDSWDFDSVQQLVLADITIKGRPRKVIMQANKNGFYYILDRLTGAFISGQPYAEVNWAKGLDEVTGRPIVNKEAHYEANTVKLAPGPLGAHNWSPMSFNFNTGLVYIPTTNGSSFNFSVDQKFEENYKPGQQNWGVVRGASRDATPPPPSIGPLPGEGQRSALVAWDPVTQTECWRVSGGGSTGGGTVTTAGNLVFQVVPDGRLLAYSADKGQKLLEIQTGLRSGMGPPTTYEIDGTQYVAVMGGLGRASVVSAEAAAATAAPAASAAPAAGGNSPRANVTANSGQVLPKLLVFVLDGTAPLPGTSQSQ